MDRDESSQVSVPCHTRALGECECAMDRDSSTQSQRGVGHSRSDFVPIPFKEAQPLVPAAPVS